MPTEQNLVLKKNLASMPQNLAFTPNKQKSASMSQNLAPMPQNLRLSIHQILASTPQKSAPIPQTKFWLSRHPKFGFQAIKKPGFLPQNLTFMPKNNHLSRFSQNDNLLIKFSNKPFPFNFCLYFIKSEFK